MTQKHTIYLLLLVVLCSGCYKDTFLTPDFLKVYLHKNDNSQNILVLNAFTTKDDDILIFSVLGNKTSKFDNPNGLEIQKISTNGDLLWKKKYENLPYGFPSNIEQVNEHYELFWSDYTTTYHYTFTDTYNHPDSALTLKKDTIVSNIEAYKSGAAYKIKSTAQNDEFYSLHFRLDNKKLSSYFMKNTQDTAHFISQYWTDTDVFFANSDYYSYAQRYSEYFSIENHNGTYYVGVPYNQEFAIGEIGNPTPIYSDQHYWPFTTYYHDDGIAAILTPQNLNDEAGLIYFAPQIKTDTYNQDFISLNSLQLNDFSSDYPIRVKKFNTDFLIAGTSQSGNIEIRIIGLDGTMKNKRTFGAGNSYTLISVLETSNQSHIMLVGYTSVSSKFQRAFVLKIATSQL